MVLIAVDPGISGAIAYHDDISRQTHLRKMPETLKERKELIDEISRSVNITEVWLEDVGMHIQGNNAQSSAKFAGHCGELRGIIVTLGLPMHLVKPVKWQKCIPNMPQRPPAQKRLLLEADKKAHRRVLGEHKRNCKKHIRAHVQQVYPKLKITDQTADALGILIFALDNRRMS